MSLLSESSVQVIDAQQTVAGNLQTPSPLTGIINVAYATLTVSTALPIGVTTARLLVPIPSGSFIYQTIVDVTTTFVGAGASIGVGVEGSNNNLTGGDIVIANWAASASADKYSPSVVTAGAVSSLNINIVAAPVTAGSAIIRVLYA